MSDDSLIDRFGNPVTVEQLLSNKNPSEIKALRYFHYLPVTSGCFNQKYVTDDEYMVLVDELVGAIDDRKSRALSRLGLDEDQVKEIPPVSFQGYTFLEGDVKGVKRDLMRLTASRRLITPTRELTWLFFGNDQVYIYKIRIDTCDNSIKSERTQEYFYKDVTAFATSSDSVTVKERNIKRGCGKETAEFVDRPVEVEKFRIVVPGEVLECAISPEDDNEPKIAAMKQKLREKKIT